MGLSNFPSPAEGMLPILVMNTILSVAILKNLLKSVLEIMGAASGGSSWVSTGLNQEEEPPEAGSAAGGARKRRVSITQFKSLCESQECDVARTGGGGDGGGGGLQAVECSVCLNRFEEEEEVSELSCKHFFHRSCLDKWFDNQHSTCPLCRSIE